MKRTTFSVLFIIKRTKELKNGLAPIYVRITVNGERNEFSLHESVSPELWNSKIGRVNGKTSKAVVINSMLNSVQEKIMKLKRDLEADDKEVTALVLRDIYLGFNEDEKTIINVFKEHNKKCHALINKDFAQGTYERYETCLKHLIDFIRYKYKKSDIKLKEITPAFISDFEYYLKVNRNCCHNTAVKYLKNFKKIIRIAIANRWMKYDPFANIRFKLNDVEIDFLTQSELEIICKKEFSIGRLMLVKDIFIFCCFTGLAFIDVKELKNDMIEKTDEGYWINKQRRKTGNRFNVPILKPAFQIIEKYQNNPICQKTKSVLPVPSNQKMNAYLKEIADICEIKKKLTTHVARHTFATTVALEKGIPLKVVSFMLGHSTVKMTEKYAKVQRDFIKKSMDSIKDKYDDLMVA